MVTILITIAQVYIHSIDEFEKAKSHLGIICCSVTLTFFAAPLANLVSEFAFVSLLRVIRNYFHLFLINISFLGSRDKSTII